LGHRTVIICARDTGVIHRTFDVVFIRQTYGRFLGRVGRVRMNDDDEWELMIDVRRRRRRRRHTKTPV